MTPPAALSHVPLSPGPQALWRTLRNPVETISHVAYRVLGKFGGSNRKMLKESQRLLYVVTEVQGPSIKAEFTDCKASIQLPMEKVGVDLTLIFEYRGDTFTFRAFRKLTTVQPRIHTPTAESTMQGDSQLVWSSWCLAQGPLDTEL